MFNVGNYMKPNKVKITNSYASSIPCEISLISLADTGFLEGFPRFEIIYITLERGLSVLSYLGYAIYRLSFPISAPLRELN